MGVSTSTLAKWRMRGVGPSYFKAGTHRIRYLPAEIDEWMKTKQCPVNAY